MSIILSYIFREIREKEGEASIRRVLNIGLELAVQNRCQVKTNVSVLIKAKEPQNSASSVFSFSSLFIQMCTVILQRL